MKHDIMYDTVSTKSEYFGTTTQNNIKYCVQYSEHVNNETKIERTKTIFNYIILLSKNLQHFSSLIEPSVLRL